MLTISQQKNASKRFGISVMAWPRRSRSVWAALAATLFLTLASTTTAQAQKPALEKSNITLAVGGKSVLIYLPLTVAERLGYFADEGLKVDIPDFAGGSKALQALVGGSADVVSGVYEHTIRMQSKGQKLEAFVALAKAMQLAFAVATPKAGEVKSLKDLKGMKIGVSAPGSTTDMMVSRILASAGLKPGDVSIIGVGLSASAVSAIASGQIDAICTAEPTASLMEQKGLIKVLVDARTEAGTEKVFGGEMATSVLYAPAAFIAQNPNTVQALTNAIIRADRWLQHATPDELARVVPEAYMAGDRASYLQAFTNVREGYSADGMIPPKGGEALTNALSEFDPTVEPSKVKVEETYTNQFAIAFARHNP